MHAVDPSSRILSDRSAFARAMGGLGGRRVAALSLSSSDRELWRALEGPAELEVVELTRPGFWSRIILLESTARSQFDLVGNLAASGFVLPGAVAALVGMSPLFHGFHGRTWQSAPGNLHLTVAIPSGDIDVGCTICLTVLPAVALVDGIVAATAGDVRPQIKWVTDICVGGKKVAGVLTRTFVSGKSAELVVHGIGVNVAHAPAIRPTPFVPAAGALPGVKLAGLFEEVLLALARHYGELLSHGPAHLLAAYREASCVRGRRVRIYPDGHDDTAPAAAWPRPVAAGLVTRIGDDLFLGIEGLERPVGSGRLAFEEDCEAFGLPPI
jgi:BirA family biotin operon repressor/biotin-[acetyl-CoA-carboxylase] ligase